MENVILKLDGIEKSFGVVRVLQGIDLELKEGQLLGVVGENGAGKSTLMNVLGGIYRRDGGTMLLDGQPYEPQRPQDAKNVGIAFIHQELSLFENLSVLENLFIDELPRKAGVFVDRKQMRTRAKEVLQTLKLDINIDAPVGSFSMGIRQLVEISKALLHHVRILIFDEPTTSLSPNEKDVLFEVINKLRQDGVSILYISHALSDVFLLSDEIMVIRDGRAIDQKPTRELDVNAVVKMMVGRELTNLFPYMQRQIGQEVLGVRGLTSEKFTDITFDVKAGELVGMFGLIGAGRSEVARGIFSLDPVSSGEVCIGGKAIRANTIDRIAEGLAFVTENRKEEGLLLNKTVQENLALVSLDDRKKKLSFVDRGQENALADGIVEHLKVKTHNVRTQLVGQLSGGNQQKIVIGKWIAKKPRVFILDEPTRGVDVGAKFEIYSRINELAEQGSGVLMISSEIEELMGMCDRILVMSSGYITANIPRDQFDQERIMEFAIERG